MAVMQILQVIVSSLVFLVFVVSLNVANMQTGCVISVCVYITLPDGSVKHVTLGGNVRLDANIVLTKVLYVPEFNFNLLSVTKLLADQKLCIHIYPTKCFFHDLTTSKVVAVAREHHGLYTLESPDGSNFKGKDDKKHSQSENGGVSVSGCFTAAHSTCIQ